MSRLTVLLLLGVSFAAGLALAYLTVVPPAQAPAARATAPPAVPLPATVPSMPGAVHSEPVVADVFTASAHGDEFTRRRALYELAAGLDVDGLRQQMDDARRHMPRPQRAAAVGILLERLAALDALAAYDYLLSLEDPEHSWIAAVFRALAQTQPEAVEELMSVLYGSARQAAAVGVLQAEGLEEPPFAQRFERALQLGALRSLPLAPHEYAAALTLAAEIDSNIARYHAMNTVLARWAGLDPVAALSAVDALDVDDNVKHNNYSQLLIQWAAEDGESALEWILSGTDLGDRNRSSLASMVFARYALQDLDAARNRLTTVDDPALRTYLETALINTWIDRDVEGALAYLATVTNPGVRRSVISIAARSLARAGTDRIDEWLLSLDVDERGRAARAVISNAENAAQARRIMETYVPNTDLARAGRSLVNRWVHEDPEAAARWVDEQRDEIQPALRANLVSQWARLDAEAAVDYALSFENGIQRDNLLASTISRRADLEQAERAFDAIEDGTRKAEAAQRLAQLLTRTDAERARALREQYPVERRQSTSVRR